MWHQMHHASWIGAREGKINVREGARGCHREASAIASTFGEARLMQVPTALCPVVGRIHPYLYYSRGNEEKKGAGGLAELPRRGAPEAGLLGEVAYSGRDQVEIVRVEASA